MTQLNHEEARHIPAHTHSLSYFCLLLSGAYREHAGGREIVYHPLSMVFHPNGMDHRDEIGAKGASFFLIEIGARWEHVLEGLKFERQTLLDLQGGGTAWLALSLHRHLAQNRVPDHLVVEETIYRMVADARRVQPLPVGKEPAWLSRIDEFLTANFRELISIERLAGEAGVHPVHLARTYRRFHRTTIANHVHRLRIQYACRAFLEGHTDLSQISLQAGFADQSHFTRIANAIAGAPPGILRRHLVSIAQGPETGKAKRP